MHCQNLTPEQRAYVYETHMTRDFPKNELKPSAMIERLIEAGSYDCLGLFDGETMVGYAYFTKLPDNGHLLLDYYAILPENRNAGYGGRFLAEFAAHYSDYQGILVEIEDPDYADTDAERTLQLRRQGFYLRSGLRKTSVYGKVFTVPFRILVLEHEQTDDRLLLDRMNALYDLMTGQERRLKNVFLKID